MSGYEGRTDVWKRDRIVGKGSFGLVTLWINKQNGEKIGKKSLKVA